MLPPYPEQQCESLITGGFRGQARLHCAHSELEELLQLLPWRLLVEEPCKALSGGSGGERTAVATALLQKLPHESVQLRDFHLQKTWPCNGPRRHLNSKKYSIESNIRVQYGKELF